MVEDKKKYILAIETSCDETAASIVSTQKTKNGYEIKVLSNVVASQIDLHEKWGGVYPELASRAHLEAMIPVLESALEPLEISQNSPVSAEGQAEVGNVKSQNCNSKVKSRESDSKHAIRNTQYAIREIDAIAVTTGPGLIGSLLMGVETAQILGAYFRKPIIEVNHLEGHIYSAFAANRIKNKELRIKNGEINLNSKFLILNSGIFPILALVVSGGHTSLILMKNHLEYETVGQTVDDAAGEAFDKVARILGLGYPGGPAIEKFAQGGDENAYNLPLSMLNSKDLNFSFSGLKTAVLYLTKDPSTQKPRKYNKKDLAASFQKTVTEILTKKTIRAIEKYNPKTIILSGGVSANEYLREYFVSEISQLPATYYQLPTILIPPRELSTDNALGIAIAGAIKFLNNKQTSWDKISARANFPIDQT